MEIGRGRGVRVEEEKRASDRRLAVAETEGKEEGEEEEGKAEEEDV